MVERYSPFFPDCWTQKLLLNNLNLSIRITNSSHQNAEISDMVVHICKINYRYFAKSKVNEQQIIICLLDWKNPIVSPVVLITVMSNVFFDIMI